MNELRWMNWSEWIDMNELKWRRWNDGIDMKDSEMNELKWSFDMNELPKRRPKPSVLFVRFLHEAELSLRFCRPHRPKVLQPRQFLTAFYVDRTLAIVPCTLFQQFSPSEPHIRGNRDPSSGDHGSDFSRKKREGFRARECFQAWGHTFLISYIPNYMMMMMMWLPWWWGDDWHDDWHDDVVAMVGKLAMTSVPRKFPN